MFITLDYTWRFVSLARSWSLPLIHTQTHTSLERIEYRWRRNLENVAWKTSCFFRLKNLKNLTFSPKIKSQNHCKWKKLRLFVCLLALAHPWLLACLCLRAPWNINSKFVWPQKSFQPCWRNKMYKHVFEPSKKRNKVLLLEDIAATSL